jgi:hypothetical protein
MFIGQLAEFNGQKVKKKELSEVKNTKTLATLVEFFARMK